MCCFFSSNFELNHSGAHQPARMIFAFVVRLAKRPSNSRIIQHIRVHIMIMICFCVSRCPLLTAGRWKLSRICFVSLRWHAYAIYCDFSRLRKWWQNVIFFLIFAQNIDLGYMLEPPHWCGSNEYPRFIICFIAILRKMYTPVNPRFTI